MTRPHFNVANLPAAFREALAPKRSKYGAKKTVVDRITFASRAEARRYSNLKLMVRAGEIADLELQPKYPLAVNNVKLGSYIADFRYKRVSTGETVVEDVKGMPTPVYRLKKKVMLALYGVKITEIK